MASNVTTVVAALLFFIGAASGHIRMTQPTPYGTPDTSPLQASGSDYPCKLQQVDEFNTSTVTDLKVGSTFHVAFYGTAVHNGGSCQFSLTKDRHPSAKSSFRTIYSILGGCPGLNGTTTYDIPVPSEVPNGDYSLSWSWYNNIGNREMYMNCAPVRVAGSNASGSDFESLPNMALYNLADYNTCKTVETYDVEFPNAGNYVEKGTTYKPMAPVGCGSYKGTDVDVGAPPSNNPQVFNSSTNLGSALAVSSSSSGLPISTSSAAGGNAGCATNLVASMEPATYTSTTGATPSNISPTSVTTPIAGVGSPVVTLASIAALSSPPATTPSASSSGSSTSVSCPSDGAIICASDGTQFGLCNFGTAIMQPVALGDKCSNDQIIKRSVKFDVNSMT